MADTRYRWDNTAARYRDAQTGQFVNEGAVRAAVDSLIETANQQVTRLSQGLVNGTVTLAGWQAQMQAALKPLHTAAYMAAHGGAHQMSPADHARIAAALKRQYTYLNRMAAQINAGAQRMDGSLVARAQLYGHAARGTFEDQRRLEMETRGYQEERRVLHPADHCGDCIQAAARGWQPLGSLPKIGATECRTRCHCTFQFRRAGETVEATTRTPT